MRYLKLYEEHNLKHINIYRGICISKKEGLDYNNIGNSWTTDESFAYDRAFDMCRLKKDKNLENKNNYEWVVLHSNVNLDVIDWQTTLGQMVGSYWDQEREVYLKDGKEIEVQILHSSDENLYPINKKINAISGGIEKDETYSEIINYDNPEFKKLKNEFLQTYKEEYY